MLTRTRKVRSLPDVVRLLLVETQWTAHALARRAGVSPADVHYIVIGRAKRPREPKVLTLGKLLRAAGKTWAWLDEVFEPEPVQASAPAKPKRGG